MAKITVGIPTRDRYTSTLPLALTSITNQTLVPDELIIYDDSSNRKDMREIEVLRYIFDLFNSKGISWKVLFGRQMGQHWGHQIIQETAKNDLIFRVDDDCVLEPKVLEYLSNSMKEGIGAVAGLVIPPNAPIRKMPPNTIENINDNYQWYRQPYGVYLEHEHLYSSYLYRKGIQDFDINLSRKAFREETLHTYGIFKKGYKLITDSTAITYHFQNSSGGIRGEKEDEKNRQMFMHDDIAFREKVREYEGHKLVILNCGKGDTLAFKPCLEPLKKKYKTVTLAVCFPELFPGEKCISIAEGALLGNPDSHNIFKYCIDKNWKEKEIKYAYADMYGVKIDN